MFIFEGNNVFLIPDHSYQDKTSIKTALMTVFLFLQYIVLKRKQFIYSLLLLWFDVWLEVQKYWKIDFQD